MKKEISKCILEIFKKYYEHSRKIACSIEEGRVFTDHNEEHIKMVLDKSNTVVNCIRKYMISKSTFINDSDYIPFSPNINTNIITAIALAHDSGMWIYFLQKFKWNLY